MKLAIDYKKLHLRFFCGTGLALFIFTRRVKRESPGDAEKIKTTARQVKRLLKDYRRKNGPFNLVEIESEGTRITIRL